MASKKKEFICPVCSKHINKTVPSISCGDCHSYFHLPCVGFDDDQIDLLTKNKNFRYSCDQCITNPKKTTENSVEMQLKLGFSEVCAKMNQSFNEQKTQMEKQMQNLLTLFEDRVGKMVNEVRDELSSDLTQVKSDVNVCQQNVKLVETSTNAKVQELVTNNNILQRRLNRSDILIRGLTKGIKNLRKPVLKIAVLCNVSLQHTDIQHCCYMAGGEVVLVKFNSIYLRDTIMANYFKIKSIYLKDILGDDDKHVGDVERNGCDGVENGGGGVGYGNGGADRVNDGSDIEKRIFLNDHLTPIASKLVYLCRDLKRKQIILKFTHINTDVPKVKITFRDKSIKVWNMDQLTQFLNESKIVDRS